MPAMLFILLGLTYLKGAVMDEVGGCCLEKEVGEIRYVLVGEENTSDYGCESGCVYKQEGISESKFCFKAGHLPVECLDGDAGSLQVRKNLTSLTDHEIHDLIHALIAAKQSGSYTGPKINGTLDEHHADFNSSFNAAASFHGYPYLCPGGCCWHVDSRFLPWHRLVMVQFNHALQANETYKHVVIPYWDWTQDFKQLPDLVQNATIIDPITKKTLENPFFHSSIPGIGKFTERTPNALINYNNKGCAETNDYHYYLCAEAGTSLLLNLTLYALSEKTYTHFESQIELPHNIVHAFLGQTQYPYTMLNLDYASFDPIFMIFHTMVDFQWAVFQKLQEHRGILHENDPHPLFDKDLHPFSTHFNANSATKLNSRGTKTVDYKNAFGYKYDNLKFNNMTIPELNIYLNTTKFDRLFAGFNLPNMQIRSIKFNVCFPTTNCVFSSPQFLLSIVHNNKEPTPGVYKNSDLTLFEVTHQLPQFGLTADQDIGFKITSTSPNAKNVTFTPVSVFREAGTQVDKITVHWLEEMGEYNYAPFFKVRPSRTNVMRFPLEDGSISVYQYSNEKDFNECSNKTLIEQEIELSGNENYYFHHPNRTGCKKENKLIVKMPQTVDTHQPGGNFSIHWTYGIYNKYKEGICMTPGTFLELNYKSSNHNVTQLTTKTDFENCESFKKKDKGVQGPLTFPESENGFEKNKSPYYIVCPVANHCEKLMKVKICVQEKCSSKTTCDNNFSVI